MRAFIALELSEEIREELSRLQNELKKTGADVKWVAPENIHLTIKFLGDIEEDKIEQIKQILDSISSRTKAFGISLFKLGAFPSLSHPRVIWAGIDKGCAEVEKIASITGGELEKVGFQKEERPFSAHLTLGRVLSGKNKDGLKQKVLSLVVQAKSCALKHVTLFRSKLTPRGAIYTPIYTAAFKD